MSTVPIYRDLAGSGQLITQRSFYRSVWSGFSLSQLYCYARNGRETGEVANVLLSAHKKVTLYWI